MSSSICHNKIKNVWGLNTLNIHHLKEKFPSLHISTKPIEMGDTVFTFYEEPYYFTINREEISESDADLLHLLFETPKPAFKTEESKMWYDFLFAQNEISLDVSSSEYRFIQFYVRRETYTKKEFSEWKKALLSFFNQNAVLLEMGAYGVIIEETSASILGEEELSAVATTLLADFYFPVHFFVGLFHSTHSSMRAAFEEERELFDLGDKALVQTVESASIKNFAKPLHTSTISKHINDFFIKDPTLFPLIAALFEHQGNISMTAKALFMHRNTIQYRMDKFHEQTNLSLRKSDGLLFAYLSGLAFKN